MNDITAVPAKDISFDRERLERLVQLALDESKRQGATSAEAAIGNSIGLSATVRRGEIDTLEHYRSQGLSLTVYRDRRKGSASTSDLSEAAVRAAVTAACSIARFTAEDPYAGLADPAHLAKTIPDLDLYHPWPISADEAVETARACEAAALAVDRRITNSDGATVTTANGFNVYANTHGFVGSFAGSRHMISCAVIAQNGEEMQTDYWYSRSRKAAALEDVAAIGRKAAEKALQRLDARRLKTGRVAVMFSPEMAASILAHFLSAIQGSVLYRQASFLLDSKGKPVFPGDITLLEQPHIPAGLGSAPFDEEGVATRTHAIVEDGILREYVLDSYSARKLGLQTTGNAGGVRNLTVKSDRMLPGFGAMLKHMGTGLLVCRMMGHGANTVTGDYSRGASGFWVENGEIQYPVEEITVAGNLKDMFARIVAVGDDIDPRSSILTGSMLVEEMTVAGE